jgi:hypothetical protein
MIHARILIAGAALIAACDGAKTAAPAAEPIAAAEQNNVGATLFYTRSNQDGTLPEHIVMHVVSPTEVHVAKMVSPCTDAAYVTAVFDPATTEATRLVGGRLQKDGTQLPQAFLDLDRATNQLTVRMGDPASPPVETHPAPAAPWRMYDFDLSEFALFGPRELEDFSLGLAMAWPDGSSPVLRILGEIKATPIGSESSTFINGDAIITFLISGPEFEGGAGDNMILFDRKHGHVVIARLSRPNHPGYDNFELVLNSVARENGEQAWREALTAHWKDCPA